MPNIRIKVKNGELMRPNFGLAFVGSSDKQVLRLRLFGVEPVDASFKFLDDIY